MFVCCRTFSLYRSKLRLSLKLLYVGSSRSNCHLIVSCSCSEERRGRPSPANFHLYFSDQCCRDCKAQSRREHLGRDGALS